jgi:hypothetical protein
MIAGGRVGPSDAWLRIEGDKFGRIDQSLGPAIIIPLMIGLRPASALWRGIFNDQAPSLLPLPQVPGASQLGKPG